jgi:putative endonuclease
MTTAAQTGGRLAETLAADYLHARGLRLLQRNYRCRMGEIDLIMADGPVLVFVEVRLRRNPGYGGAAASIGAVKRQRILRAARHYLSGKPEPPCRFDVVLLDSLAQERIEWIKDAFGE